MICMSAVRRARTASATYPLMSSLLSLQVPAFESSDGARLFESNAIAYYRKCSQDGIVKDVVTPYAHISEASRYILYTIILTFDGICTIS